MEHDKMAVRRPTLFLLSFPILFASLSSASHVSVLTSFVEEVPKYATAIIFRIQLENSGHHAENATLSFTHCCWEIEPGDTDCEVMVLRPGVVQFELAEKNFSTATFAFYNLYTRYRQGECHFTVSTSGIGSSTWTHTIPFDTTPKPNSTFGSDGLFTTNFCEGLDQDPDRDCGPVDCAVKYRGARNFYRNTTGRCERVATCNTRGDDGVSIVAYYDRETNICHRFDWMEDNEINQIESDTEIPTAINSSKAKYFTGFEPTKLAKEHVTLQCNHGQQTGIYCQCEEGWESTGIDRENPTVYHWCDKETALPKFAQSRMDKPKHLTKAVEVVITLFLTLVNLFLLGLWLYLLCVFTFKLCSPNDLATKSLLGAPLSCCCMLCRRKPSKNLLNDSVDEDLYYAS